MDTPPRAEFLVQIRQACAEDRAEDAFDLYEAAPEAWIDWFSADIVSRTDEADALLRNIEVGHGTHGLLNFLLYPQFDASQFPSLVRVLQREEIEIRAPRTIPFACSRTDRLR